MLMNSFFKKSSGCVAALLMVSSANSFAHGFDIEEKLIARRSTKTLVAMTQATGANLPAAGQQQQQQEIIPPSILASAECVATLRIFKASLVAGGKTGEGVMSCRQSTGAWSAPAYVEIDGLSLGLQVGFEWNDVVLVFGQDTTARLLKHSQFIFGTDVAVRPGPTTAVEAARNEAAIRGSVLAYSARHGFYAGAALEGSSFRISDDENHDAYGHHTKGVEILSSSTVVAPNYLQPFTQVLTAVAAR